MNNPYDFQELPPLERAYIEVTRDNLQTIAQDFGGHFEASYLNATPDVSVIFPVGDKGIPCVGFPSRHIRPGCYLLRETSGGKSTYTIAHRDVMRERFGIGAEKENTTDGE